MKVYDYFDEFVEREGEQLRREFMVVQNIRDGEEDMFMSPQMIVEYSHFCQRKFELQLEQARKAARPDLFGDKPVPEQKQKQKIESKPVSVPTAVPLTISQPPGNTMTIVVFKEDVVGVSSDAFDASEFEIVIHKIKFPLEIGLQYQYTWSQKEIGDDELYGRMYLVWGPVFLSHMMSHEPILLTAIKADSRGCSMEMSCKGVVVRGNAEEWLPVLGKYGAVTPIFNN